MNESGESPDFLRFLVDVLCGSCRIGFVVRQINEVIEMSELSQADQIKQLREALETLVALHKDWDKGTAYVQVRFIEKNNAAISAAREALRNSQ